MPWLSGEHNQRSRVVRIPSFGREGACDDAVELRACVWAMGG